MCRDQAFPARHLQQDVAPPWRGVNLGGWLLLEPGTAKALFARHHKGGVAAQCEWKLMETLRARHSVHELWHHRETHTTKADFYQIRDCGLNAVRLPVGYWTVLGAAPGEPYEGPALEYIDKAVQWAEECGLQVVLDLHGAPGGESSDAPCGRCYHPCSAWTWESWRFDESLRALNVLAHRYCRCRVVTGIEVCNEPSRSIPSEVLCQYYDSAVKTIRAAGMHQVTVVLPVFQRSLDEFAQLWDEQTAGTHKNICFDLHYYHCFGHTWHGKTFAQQLRSVEEHAQELRQFPAVVGEWSLALGDAASNCALPGDVARSLFGRVQLAAYAEASHGWFFWNWVDSHGTEWNWQQSFREGSVRGPQCKLPMWDGLGEDPLEEDFDPSPAEPRIRAGDAICLRSYHGRYLTVTGSRVRVKRANDSTTCQFILWTPRAELEGNSVLQHGDIVHLMADNGTFLSVEHDHVYDAGTAMEFVVHVEGAGALQHRAAVFLQSRATSWLVDVNGSDDDQQVQARWEDFGEWQRFIVEKTPDNPNRVIHKIVEQREMVTPPRRRRSSLWLGKSSPSPRKRCCGSARIWSRLCGRSTRPRRSLSKPSLQRRLWF